ncbi:hypothetical protein BX616_007822, partial [Lobosporangium transversale]
MGVIWAVDGKQHISVLLKHGTDHIDDVRTSTHLSTPSKESELVLATPHLELMRLVRLSKQ